MQGLITYIGIPSFNLFAECFLLNCVVCSGDPPECTRCFSGYKLSGGQCGKLVCFSSSFPGFPSSFPSLAVREKRKAGREAWERG